MQPTPSGSVLTIFTKKPPMGILFDPKAEINGHAVPLIWGRNDIPAPPGVHRIKLWVPWMWKTGKAEITVDNTHGQAPPVYYASPYTNFNAGAIGHQPVKNPGLVALLATIAVPLVLVLVCCVGASLMNSGSGY